MLNETIMTTTTEMTVFGDDSRDELLSVYHTNQTLYFYPVVEFLSKFYQVFIIVIGLIGNTITIVIFGRSKQKLRRTSDTAFYLISLAIIDILSLFTITGKYLDTYKWAKLGRYDTWCKSIVYLNFVLNFISCGIVVTFTLQRLCSICFPLRSASSNIHRHSKLILSMLVTTGFLIYMPVWSKFRSNQGFCDYAPGGDDFMQRFLFLDSLLTLIIPFLGLLIMNAMIIRTLKNSNYNFVIRNSSNRHFHEPPNNQHPVAPGAEQNPNNNNIAIQHYNNGIIPNGNTQTMNNNFDNLQMGVDMGLGLAVNSANNSPGTLIYSKPKRNSSILKTSKKGLDENGKQKQTNSPSFKVAKFTSSKTGDGNTIINNNHNHQPSFRNDSFELEPLNNRYHHHANSNSDSQLRFHNSFLFLNGGNNKKRHSSIDKSKCCEDCFASLLRTHSDSSSIYSSSILTQNLTGGAVVAAQNNHHHHHNHNHLHHHHHHQNSQHCNHQDLNGSFISGFKQKRRGQIVLKTINSSGVMAERTSTGGGSTTLNCTTTQQQQNRNNTSPSNSTVNNNNNNNNAATDLANIKQQPNSTNSVFDAVNGEFANGGAKLPSSQKDKKRRSIFGFRGREKKNSEDHFNIAPHLRKNGGGGGGVTVSSMNESMENQMNNTNTGTTRGSVNQKPTNSNHRRSTLMNGGGGGNGNGARYSTTARIIRANSYRHGGAHQTKSASHRVTKMLILVSSVFLVLNFPVHAYNLYVYYKVSLLKLHDPYAQFSPNQIEYNLEEIVLIIFFTSFSCNFLLYSISGVTFRNEFKRLFFKIFRIKRSSPKPPIQR